MPPTFALSFHADYGCRERGACCTAGWPIPIEPDRRARVEVALARGELDDVAAAPAVFVTANHVTAAEALVAVHDGVCVFHSSRGAQRCAIHRALGHTALPLACRQFPRVTVHDPRGTSVTLSHYCPTAAEHLLRPGPIVIDDTPAAFPPDGEYAGLDAAGGLPPLLTPTVLMDWEGWWALERAAVALISETTTSHEALARLDRLVSEVEQWRPGSHAFADHVRAATHTARSEGAVAAAGMPDAVERVHGAIPDEWRPPIPALRRVQVSSAVHVRFLAAHAFANWTAHLGNGLRAWMRSIEAADGLIAHGFTVQEADLWLRHLVDPQALAEAVGGRGC